MPMVVRDEVLERLAARKDDPEVEEGCLVILHAYLSARPEVRQGILQEGELKPLLHQFERRLARALTEAERNTLTARVRELGAERVGDVVLDLSPEDLAPWLAA